MIHRLEIVQAQPLGQLAGINLVTLVALFEQWDLAWVADQDFGHMQQLVLNSKTASADEVFKKVRRSKGKGFNSETRRVEDLIAAGVVDPVAIVIKAIKLAYANARTFLEAGAWDSAVPDSLKKSALGEETPPIATLTSGEGV